jgi:hypothetical protein
MFDSLTDTFRTAMDAGRKSQENFFRAVGDVYKTPADSDGFFGRGERMAREFVPFVGKNVQTFSECAETTFRTQADMIKLACDTVARTDDADVYRRTRTMWDATFGATRANIEAFGKAGTRMVENFSDFCRSACAGCPETGPKSSSKPASK